MSEENREEENEMDIPSEIIEDLQAFHENLKKMEEVLHPLTTTNVNSLDVKVLCVNLYILVT